jgi:hypothetical protein
MFLNAWRGDAGPSCPRARRLRTGAFRPIQPGEERVVLPLPLGSSRASTSPVASAASRPASDDAVAIADGQRAPCGDRSAADNPATTVRRLMRMAAMLVDAEGHVAGRDAQFGRTHHAPVSLALG